MPPASAKKATPPKGVSPIAGFFAKKASSVACHDPQPASDAATLRRHDDVKATATAAPGGVKLNFESETPRDQREPLRMMDNSAAPTPASVPHRSDGGTVTHHRDAAADLAANDSTTRVVVDAAAVASRVAGAPSPQASVGDALVTPAHPRRLMPAGDDDDDDGDGDDDSNATTTTPATIGDASAAPKRPPRRTTTTTTTFECPTDAATRARLAIALEEERASLVAAADARPTDRASKEDADDDKAWRARANKRLDAIANVSKKLADADAASDDDLVAIAALKLSIGDLNKTDALEKIDAHVAARRAKREGKAAAEGGGGGGGGAKTSEELFAKAAEKHANAEETLALYTSNPAKVAFFRADAARPKATTEMGRILKGAINAKARAEAQLEKEKAQRLKDAEREAMRVAKEAAERAKREEKEAETRAKEAQREAMRVAKEEARAAREAERLAATAARDAERREKVRRLDSTRLDSLSRPHVLPRHQIHPNQSFHVIKN